MAPSLVSGAAQSVPLFLAWDFRRVPAAVKLHRAVGAVDEVEAFLEVLVVVGAFRHLCTPLLTWKRRRRSVFSNCISFFSLSRNFFLRPSAMKHPSRIGRFFPAKYTRIGALRLPDVGERG